MWATGSVGDNDVLYFVDSGYVTLDDTGRQPSLLIPGGVVESWGVEAEEGQFIEPGRIVLGNASREGGSAAIAPDTRNFGGYFGLQPQVLLSFGFLRHFNWTIDFDAYEYRLVPVKVAVAGEVPSAVALEVPLGEYAGSYEVAPGVVLEVAVGDAQLMLRAPGQSFVGMSHEGKDRFAISLAGATIVFERGDDRSVTGLVLDQAGNETRARRLQ